MECKNLPPCYNNDKNCMCFTDSDSTNPEGDQFCGYIGADGETVYPCAANCCNGGLGCPGQCRGVDAKRPDFIRNVVTKGIEYITIASEDERLDFFEKVIKLLIALIVISSLSLFIGA